MINPLCEFRTQLNHVRTVSEHDQLVGVNGQVDIDNSLWFTSHAKRCNLCKNCVQSRNEVHRLIHIHHVILQSGLPNYKGCRIPVKSGLNISFLRNELIDYDDQALCEFLQFGFPIGITITPDQLLDSNVKGNHLGAVQYPKFIEEYLAKEVNSGSVLGPFRRNPFNHPIAISPLNSVPKRDSEERRVIVDLSWPLVGSVNSFIPKIEYLGSPINLTYPTVDSLVRLIKVKGPGCLLFKKDLKRAYRQLPVDPKDWGFLCYKWKDHIYMDRVLTMGLRSACLCCQRTTSGIKFMYRKLGYELVNYIDDLAGAEVKDRARDAYNVLGELLLNCGLQESPEKSGAPSTRMIFLGVLLDTILMCMEVTPNRTIEILEILELWTDKTHATKKEVQSLVGKLVFISACVRSSRIFISRMLNFLREMPDLSSVLLPVEFYKDVKWWRFFAPLYKGVSLMYLEEFNEPDMVAASDACLTGCGGTCSQFYFHKQFPQEILSLNLSINALELLTICVCAKVWGRTWAGKQLVFFCDNESSVYLLNSGKARMPFMQQCLREISFQAATHDFQLRGRHIAGEENRIPDWLSRWHLNPAFPQKFYQACPAAVPCEIGEELFQFTHDW